MNKIFVKWFKNFQIIGIGILMTNMYSCNSRTGQIKNAGVQPDVFNNFTLLSSEIRTFIGLDSKLAEVGGDSIDLMNLKSKVLLIDFTGVSCIPCKEAIPFLNQLVIDKKGNDFELISIETETKGIEELLKHKKKNRMNYKYLVGGEDVLTKFKISGVPSFFILDEKRMVRKYFLGYTAGITDKQIREFIDKLL